MDFNLGFYLIDHRLLAVAMVAVLAVASEIGFRLGSRSREAQESFRSLISGTGAAMLGVMGLLLGFTLAMAVSRWDERHDVVVDESNAIGTLWLRAGLLEEPLRGELRDALRQYTDARIALGGSRDDRAALRAERSKSESLHATIWSTVERANELGMSPAILTSLITSANELIDIHELRLASITNFLPAPLMLLLVGVAGVAIGFLAWSFGAIAQGGRTTLLVLALLIGIVLLVIMDINRPQRGRIEVGIDSLERVAETMVVQETKEGTP